MAKSKRPPKTKQKIFIGVDLGGTNVRAGLVSFDKLLKLKSQKVRSQGSAEDVFADLCSVIDAVIDSRVAGIGIGVPSLVDVKTGTILDTTNIPSWKSVPLKKWLEKKYRVPVRIDNDANCFALGEKYFGHGRGCENFVGLIIGTGLGAGIISHGRLHSGTDCGAGEFGLIPYQESIVEHYASGQFFGKFNIDGPTLFQQAEAGEARALEIFNEYGRNLGHAIKIVMYTLAPEMIIFGGSVAKSRKFFARALNESLQDFAYASVLKKTKIKTSSLKNSAVLGAASLMSDDLARH